MSDRRLQLIACRVFERELAAVLGPDRSDVAVRFLDIGLHEKSAKSLHDALQAAIDETPADCCDAIGLVYGLCNRGLVGLQARARPVVIPRAHDCIGLLLGDTRRYLAQLSAHPNSYFQSPGWVEHLPASRSILAESVPVGGGVMLTEAELIARYGEDNARYLLAQLVGADRTAYRLVYIATPVADTERWAEEAAYMAQRHGWAFERLPGEFGWLRRLVEGPWPDEEFLTLQPGERVALRYDAKLIAAEKP